MEISTENSMENFMEKFVMAPADNAKKQHDHTINFGG